jgi:hypothetical protein
MALWSGVAVWGSAPHRVAPLTAGLAVIAAGAVILGRSKAVAKVAGSAEMASEEAVGGCRGCSPNPSWAYRIRREGAEAAASKAGNGRASRAPVASLADDG